MKRTIALLIIALGLTLGAAAPAYANDKANDKVAICHVTDAENNRYRHIEVSVNATDGLTKQDHEHHERDGFKDIIPADETCTGLPIEPEDPEVDPLPGVDVGVPLVTVQPIVTKDCTETSASFTNLGNPWSVAYEFGGELVVILPGETGVRSAVAYDGVGEYYVSINGEPWLVGGCPAEKATYDELAADDAPVEELPRTGATDILVKLAVAVGLILLGTAILIVIRTGEIRNGWRAK
jgi:hypothetical protein